MDPNANLSEQSALLFYRAKDHYDKARLSELRHALQDWLHNGGFEPVWAGYPDAAKAFRRWQRRAAKIEYGNLQMIGGQE